MSNFKATLPDTITYRGKEIDNPFIARLRRKLKAQRLVWEETPLQQDDKLFISFAVTGKAERRKPAPVPVPDVQCEALSNGLYIWFYKDGTYSTKRVPYIIRT